MICDHSRPVGDYVVLYASGWCCQCFGVSIVVHGFSGTVRVMVPLWYDGIDGSDGSDGSVMKCDGNVQFVWFATLSDHT